MIAKGTRKVVQLRDIRIGAQHWDRTMTEEGLESLSDSFELIGQLNPITVRPIGKIGRSFELIAGRRRLEAMRRTGHKEIEVKVVRCSDEEARVMSLVENLQVEKPTSREWSAGAKELVDLTEKRLTREQKKRRARDTQKTGAGKAKGKHESGELRGPGPQKAVGRPKTTRTTAVEETAKTLGVDERAVRKAYRREADLISSAKVAWEKGKITDKQADMLANMTKTNQRRQLSRMVNETQTTTQKRRQEETAAAATTKGDSERHTIRALGELVSDIKQWKKRCASFMRYVDGRNLDWDRVFKESGVKPVDLEPCAEQLNELHEFLACD